MSSRETWQPRLRSTPIGSGEHRNICAEESREYKSLFGELSTISKNFRGYVCAWKLRTARRNISGRVPFVSMIPVTDGGGVIEI